MLHASISELTTLRWDLATEIEHLSRHSFNAVSLWRTKLSDVGADVGRRLLQNAGIRVSSLQWAGGFTGSDGRSHIESIDDALEAIETAAAVGTRVLLVHTGCRGGHTLRHANRLLQGAFNVLAPAAYERGVTLAVKPFHHGAAVGCGFLTRLPTAIEWVERFEHPAVRLVLDLWQFGHDPGLLQSLFPQLVPLLALVQVADSHGAPTTDRERLPPGLGQLPLENLVAELIEFGYRGDIEVKLVGETVEAMGYDQVLRQARLTADRWARAVRLPATRQGDRTADGHRAIVGMHDLPAAIRGVG